jgi:putative endonuclease
VLIMTCLPAGRNRSLLFIAEEYICFMFNKNFSKEPTEKQKIGQIGEDFACEYLSKEGYKIIDRNYLKKWGEIDIVAKKGKKIHFVEVKSVSRDLSNVIHETPKNNDSYRAEDNMHPWKLQRLARTIQSYLLDKDIPEEIEWQFDLATVYIDMSKRISRVLLLEDIVL